MVSSHGYRHDSLNRRTQALLEDGSTWQYGYNDRDELVGARRFWSDWSPAAGQQFTYDYDSIGNRKSAEFGGDVNGQNLRQINYGADSLNQYTNIATPGYASILGVALATDQVWVNTNCLADRKGEYFHSEVPVANSTARWQGVSIASGGSTTNGGLVFPASSQALRYDRDGNLTNDGIWTYEWDAENRLKCMWMTNIAGLDASKFTNRLRLDFIYDYQGRRVSKAVSAWDGSQYTNASTTLFVYDGWNVIAELSASRSIQRGYMWGQDLSGTMAKAGGVGGLLGVFEVSNRQVSNAHFACYDGNGNVTALVQASNAATTARYEYSPFGEVLRVSGAIAKANPLRFSTKFADDETGLVYYGYRYLSPSQGRWIGRDVAEEPSGLNTYAYTINRPLQLIDPDGAAAVEYDGTGLHVNVDRRGGNRSLAYVFTVDEKGVVGVGQKGKHYFEAAEAAAHWDEFRKKSGTINKVLNVLNQAEDVYKAAKPTISRLKDWAKAGAELGRKATIALAGVGTIAYMFNNSASAAETFDSYMKNRVSGDSAYGDLDAVDLAIQTMNATGNYFYGYATLDVLLPD